MTEIGNQEDDYSRTIGKGRGSRRLDFTNHNFEDEGQKALKDPDTPKE